MNALRELLAVFQIAVDDEELEKSSKKLEGFLGHVRKVGEVVAEAFALHAVSEFFDAQVEGAAHLQDLSEKLDISANSLKSFGFAAQSSGVDLDTAAHALGFLNRNVGEAVTGGGEAAQAFAKLGVSLKDANGKTRDVQDILFDVSDGLAKLPDQQTRAAYAMKVFGREGQVLLPILSKGSEALGEMFKESQELGSGLGDKFYKDAKKAREEMEHFHFVLASIKQRILAAALPAFTGLYERLKKMALPVLEFAKHTNVLQHILGIGATTATIKLTLTLAKLAKTFGLLKPSIGGTILQLLKLGWPVALALVLFGVFDDLFTLMEGGQSVIGDVLEEIGGLQEKNAFVADLKDAWAQVVEVWQEAKPLAFELFKGLIESIPTVVKVFLGLVEVTRIFLDTLVSIGKVLGSEAFGAISGITKLFQGDFKGAGNALKAGNEAAFEGMQSSGNDMLKAFDTLGKLTGVHPLSGVAGDTAVSSDAGNGQFIPFSQPVIRGQAAPVTHNHTNNVHVEVKTGATTDPKQIGNQVGTSVANELQREKYNALNAIEGT